MEFLSPLHHVADGQTLSVAQAEAAMTLILEGEATTAQIAAFLMALRLNGDTADQLLGFARAMRAKATRIPFEQNGEALLDTCGTGGDNCGTFNISTVTALVVAGAGVRVAKHGNRSLATHCGSADILEALGVCIELAPAEIAANLETIGFGFLYAPAMHPAMRYAQPARQELKMRTTFNLLGPLTNPAGANCQLAGAPSVPAARLMADVLARLGLPRGFVVHGADGLDEVSLTGPTTCFAISNGEVAEQTLAPDDFGLPMTTLETLRGGDRRANAAIAEAVLAGEPGPRRDIVLANAALALLAAGRVMTLPEGVEEAAVSIDSGAAGQVLQKLRQ